jgi:hypothetical protein
MSAAEQAFVFFLEWWVIPFYLDLIAVVVERPLRWVKGGWKVMEERVESNLV